MGVLPWKLYALSLAQGAEIAKEEHGLNDGRSTLQNVAGQIDGKMKPGEYGQFSAKRLQRDLDAKRCMRTVVFS